MISLVINTCSLGPRAAFGTSSGGRAHSEREWYLKNLILPNAEASEVINDIVIVGEFEEDPNGIYKYVECPSENFDCTDALKQRQLGFEKTFLGNEWIIFQHDDHMLDPYFSDWWPSLKKTIEEHDYGVVSPERWCRSRDWAGERLNNGAKDRYLSGHMALVRRDIAETCPWEEVPKVFTWDIEYTRMIQRSNFNISLENPNFICYDVEFGATPWK
jgi:hypothetical protein